MTKLTNLERTRIQMQYAVPLIRDLQEILGEQVINEALGEMHRRRAARAAQSAREADFTRMKAGTEMFAAGGALDYEITGESDDHFDMDVTGCRYAELMADMDATDIGTLLICNGDFADALKIGMELKRTQTRMQGADCCDFRYCRR